MGPPGPGRVAGDAGAVHGLRGCRRHPLRRGRRSQWWRWVRQPERGQPRRFGHQLVGRGEVHCGDDRTGRPSTTSPQPDSECRGGHSGGLVATAGSSWWSPPWPTRRSTRHSTGSGLSGCLAASDSWPTPARRCSSSRSLDGHHGSTRPARSPCTWREHHDGDPGGAAGRRRLDCRAVRGHATLDLALTPQSWSPSDAHSCHHGVAWRPATWAAVPAVRSTRAPTLG